VAVIQSVQKPVQRVQSPSKIQTGRVMTKWKTMLRRRYLQN